MQFTFEAKMTGNFGTPDKWDWRSNVPVVITAEIEDYGNVKILDWNEKDATT